MRQRGFIKYVFLSSSSVVYGSDGGFDEIIFYINFYIKDFRRFRYFWTGEVSKVNVLRTQWQWNMNNDVTVWVTGKGFLALKRRRVIWHM